MPLISINDLSVSFHSSVRGEMVKAVQSVSLSIEKGEVLALVGESGSGKSVTALSILGLLPYPVAFHPSGRIVFDGVDILKEATSYELPVTSKNKAATTRNSQLATVNLLRSLRGSRISMIFQEPMTSLNPLHTIGRQIAEVMEVHEGRCGELGRAGEKTYPTPPISTSPHPNPIQARTVELLSAVGLSHFSDRLDAYPHQLSGGERQRVMIAMAIANNPELLIADEPTTAVDVTVQVQILSLLKKLQNERGMAMLFITHDLTLVRKMADRVAVMRHGQVVECGKVAEVFSRPAHEYTKMLLASEPKGAPAPLPARADALMSCRGLVVHFSRKRGWFGRDTNPDNAVDNVSLTLRRGETLGIVGESGSGKSTLAYALLRLQKSRGEITYEDQRLDRLDSSGMLPLRRKMQIVFQDPYASLNPRLTVAETVAEGLLVHQPQMTERERHARAASILEEVGLSADMLQRYPHEFSGGQRQRIAIARAMILKPALVTLDEPTSALDLSVQAQILDLLRSLQSRYGLSYLFISHDLRVIRAISHRVAVMRRGRIVEEGETQALFKAPREEYTRSLIAAAN